MNLQKLIVALLVSSLFFTACEDKEQLLDEKGRIEIKKLTTSSGAYNLAPMNRIHNPENISSFKPEVFSLDEKKYNGPVIALNPSKKIIAEGNLKDGLYDGKWTYYFGSGVVQIEGNYKDGKEVGIWVSYYRKNVPKVLKYYNEDGAMLMRTDFNDDGKIVSHYNIKSTEFPKELGIDEAKGITYEYLDKNGELYIKGGKVFEKIGKDVLQQTVFVKKTMNE